MKERKKKQLKKTLLTTPIWQKKNKIATQKNKLVFFFRFLELFLFAMENHFKNLLQIFLNTTESKSLILLAKTEIGFANFVFLQTFFEKRKNNYKIQTYLRNLNSHHVGLFWKMKEARKSKQKHKITLNDIWALLIIVYLVKKKLQEQKENINHNLYVTWTKQLTTMTGKKMLEIDLLYNLIFSMLL